MSLKVKRDSKELLHPEGRSRRLHHRKCRDHRGWIFNKLGYIVDDQTTSSRNSFHLSVKTM